MEDKKERVVPKSFKFLHDKTIYDVVFGSENKDDDKIDVYKYMIKKLAPTVRSFDNIFSSGLKNLKLISTGVGSIDNILNGGIYSSEITEFYGRSCSGKSEIAHRMCASFLSSNENLQELSTKINSSAKGGTVAYIDVKGDFFVQKFKNLMIPKIDNFLSPFMLLKLKETKTKATNILLAKCFGSLRKFSCFFPQDLLDSLVFIKEHVSASRMQTYTLCGSKYSPSDVYFFSKLRLIVIDGITQAYLPYTGVLQDWVNNHLFLIYKEMRCLTEECNIPVVIFNNSRKNNDQIDCGCLGQAWADIPDCRVQLWKCNGDNESEKRFKACVYKSRLMSELDKSAEFVF